MYLYLENPLYNMYMHVRMFGFICTSMCVCTCVCTSVCVYVCVCVRVINVCACLQDGKQIV